MRIVVTTLLLLGVMLAGCTDSPDASTPGEPATPDGELEAGKGAIAGLVIDERFRPVPGAIVLVQQTGQQVPANDNGEFFVLNLNPGAYTLRVQAEGHEAAPSQVDVEEGVYADANLIARRTFSDGGQIVTTEFAIFIPCNAYATVGCPPDLSGDTFRPGIYGNWEEYLPALTYSTWEVLLNNPYIFCFEVRESSGTGASLDRHFANWCEGQDSTYTKGILQTNATYDETVSNDPWDPSADTEAILFTFGNNEATCWEKPPNDSQNRYRCVGVGFAIKAQIMVSFFLGEPETDIEEYCILCG